MSDALLPCPFCGENLRSYLWGESLNWRHPVNTCLLSGGWDGMSNHPNAIAAWNRRAEPHRVDTELHTDLWDMGYDAE